MDCQIQPVSVCIKKRFFFAPKRLFFAPKLTRSPSFRHFPPLLGTQIIVTTFHPFPPFGEYFLPKQHLRKAKSENSFTIFYNLIEKRINGNSRPFTVIRVEEKKNVRSSTEENRTLKVFEILMQVDYCTSFSSRGCAMRPVNWPLLLNSMRVNFLPTPRTFWLTTT